MKKIIGLLLFVTLLLSICPFVVLAEGTKIVDETEYTKIETGEEFAAQLKALGNNAVELNLWIENDITLTESISTNKGRKTVINIKSDPQNKKKINLNGNVIQLSSSSTQFTLCDVEFDLNDNSASKISISGTGSASGCIFSNPQVSQCYFFTNEYNFTNCEFESYSEGTTLTSYKPATFKNCTFSETETGQVSISASQNISLTGDNIIPYVASQGSVLLSGKNVIGKIKLSKKGSTFNACLEIAEDFEPDSPVELQIPDLDDPSIIAKPAEGYSLSEQQMLEWFIVEEPDKIALDENGYWTYYPARTLKDAIAELAGSDTENATVTIYKDRVETQDIGKEAEVFPIESADGAVLVNSPLTVSGNVTFKSADGVDGVINYSDSAKLSNTDTEALLQVKSGNVSVEGVTFDAAGKDRVARIEGGASLTLNSGAALKNGSNRLARTMDGLGVYVANGASLTLNEGSIIADNCNKIISCKGVGVYNYRGTVTMNGGEISGNHLEGTGSNLSASGLAIYNDQGTVTISGGKLVNNTGVYNVTQGANGAGGAIYNAGVNESKGILNISGETEISGNKAYHGGAIYNTYGKVVITGPDVKITGNTAVVGGAVYNVGSINIYQASTDAGYNFGELMGLITLDNVTLTGNKAEVLNSSSADTVSYSGLGGAIFVKSGTVTVNGGAITGNSTIRTDESISPEHTWACLSNNGCGIYVDGCDRKTADGSLAPAKIVLIDTAVTGNSISTDGGATGLGADIFASNYSYGTGWNNQAPNASSSVLYGESNVVMSGAVKVDDLYLAPAVVIGEPENPPTTYAETVTVGDSLEGAAVGLSKEVMNEYGEMIDPEYTDSLIAVPDGEYDGLTDIDKAAFTLNLTFAEGFEAEGLYGAKLNDDAELEVMPVEAEIKAEDTDYDAEKAASGEGITTTVTVKDGEAELAEGTDFELAYENNKAEGTATITASGIGSYVGSISATFEIRHVHSLEATEAKAATCTEAGNSAYWTCTGCGRYFSDEKGENEIEKDSWVIAALGHKAESIPAVLATCTEKGLTEGSRCSVCGEILKAQEEVAALGHKWGEWTVVKAATETEEGQEQRVCANDPSHIETRSVDKLEPAKQDEPAAQDEPAKQDTPAVSSDSKFTDVAEASNIYKPVSWAVKEGIVKGYTDGSFKPEDSCTREQFAIMMWRFAGQPEADIDAANRFTDIDDFSNNTSRRAVAWAVEEGIINGFNDGHFGPEETVTRRQVVAMLWRWAGRPSATKNTGFSDVSASESTYKAIQWGAEAGLVKGYSDGTFKPEDDCQRQHIVIFLYRFARDVLDEDVN